MSSAYYEHAHFARVGTRRGCAVTCRMGHTVQAVSLDKLPREEVDELQWRLCDRCDENRMFFAYRCTACKDSGKICAPCVIGSTTFCPQGHVLQRKVCNDSFINCERCDSAGRKIRLECAFGRHYCRTLCAACVGREYEQLLDHALEPTFGPALSVSISLRFGMDKLSAAAAERFPRQLTSEISKLIGVEVRHGSKVPTARIFVTPLEWYADAEGLDQAKC